MLQLKLDFDLDVDTGRQIELLQLIDGFGRGLNDVEQALVGAHFELVHALLVNVGGAIDRVALDLGRQRDGPGDDGTGAGRGFGDLGRGAIEQTVVKCLEGMRMRVSAINLFTLLLFGDLRDDLCGNLFEV